MSAPYLSEIRIMSFNYPPKGWALCNGQLLGINANQALFSLLGTTYGGDGRKTFGLPNLQGRVPLHFGNGFVLGQQAGETAHTLLYNEMPLHNHLIAATAATATTDIPGPSVYLGEGQSKDTGTPGVSIYSTAGQSRSFAAAAISNTGGSQPHPNQQPYLVLNFCISLQGIFPSQN
jgi:microcystin-dependent protein